MSDIGGVAEAASSFKSRVLIVGLENLIKSFIFRDLSSFSFSSTHPLDSADHYLACNRVTFCHFSRGAIDVSCDFVVRRGRLGSIKNCPSIFLTLLERCQRSQTYLADLV